MLRSGRDTFLQVREHFLSQFERLGSLLLGETSRNKDFDPDYVAMVFLFNSIQFLSKLYKPPTAIKVLSTVSRTVEGKNKTGKRV